VPSKVALLHRALVAGQPPTESLQRYSRDQARAVTASPYVG